MTGKKSLRACLLSIFLCVLYLCVPTQATQAQSLPLPSHPFAGTNNGPRSIVLAGGCFWGMQLIYQHMIGVTSVLAGYAGGEAQTAHYERVSEGNTGHAEAVKITYDPRLINLSQLLQVYFSVAHDPTELNRQGPDQGTQYRSAFFYSTDEERHYVENYIDELNKSQALKGPIVTKMEPLNGFYVAEDHHQNYATLHPESRYIQFYDLPKLERFKHIFPTYYKEMK